MTSKIKVDNIENQCGGAVVTKCGGTTTISGSVVKANDIQASDGGNLVSQCGATITIGASGDTVSLASGASQSGFGRSGTVDWQTGSIKTATFTATNGEGYFCNTTSGAFTVNLPAGSAGAIVSVQDYNNTFDSNNLTLAPNGSEKINGGAGTLKLSAEGQGLTLVYVDGTVGWRSVQENEFETAAESFVTATGGTITTCGDYKIHQFTGPGTFSVTAVGGASCAPNPSVADYLVVAGGGSGAPYALGGGGAGGFRLGSASPASTPLSASGITLTVQDYPITVGGGGAAPPGQNQGSNSIFSTITSTGGGAGGNSPPSQSPDLSAGGSGGAIGRDAYLAGRTTAGNGNSPPVSPSQGNPGGVHQYPSCTSGSRGGGGAGAAGTNGGPPSPGGAGAPVTPIFGASPKPYYTGSPANGSFAGGGGGGTFQGNSGSGGGSGPGSASNLPSSSPGGDGQTNTGGGGGGSGPGALAGGAGGSGIVLIRYKFQ